MKVIVAGSTVMVGGLILDLCLNAEQVTEIVRVVRKKTSRTHPKLNEVLISDFEDYSNHELLFTNAHAGFFCIGIYTGQVSKELFKAITVNYAVAFAKELQKYSPNANLCLLSGAGADRTEKSSTTFARFKGIAENRISALGIRLYAFRPAYIYPVKKRKEPNLMYRVSRRLYPIIKLFGKNASITSIQLAQAMFHVGLHGADKEVLENEEILNHIS